MAFTPVQVKKEINGTEFVAQFAGALSCARYQQILRDDTEEFIKVAFKHIIVSPQIEDVEEYFGTDMPFLTQVVEFATQVIMGDPEIFPKTNGKTVKKADKE